jgi:uncharacterized lipoprotein YajG
MFALWAIAPGFGLFGLLLFGGRQVRKRINVVLMLLVMVAASILWTGCGGGNTTTVTTPPKTGNPTPAGTYTVLVIGTSGSVQHFTSLTLIVQ